MKNTEPMDFLADNKARAGHGEQSLRSGMVSVAGRGANVIVQVGSTICLARLLTPEDFGLVAMVAAITGFAPVLIDLGTRDAAVQRDRLTQDEVSALFWLTVAIGGGLSLLLVITAPLIARFYGEARLTEIAVVSSLTFIVSALSCQHVALLRRAMLFKQIATIEVGANAVGAAAAIGLAFAGAGYWALVLRPVLVSIVTSVAVWMNCRWLPGVPKFNSGVREMLKFGLNVTGFTMTDYVGRAADRVALGYATGARELGFYQNSFLVYDNALSIMTTPLHGVAVASLSKLRDKPDELRRSWATALSSLAFFAMPAFVVLAVVGQDVVVLLLGTKWIYAGALLSVIALRGPAHVVERTMGWLHVAAGRADRWMRWGVISTVVQLMALICGLPYGARGVATAYTITMYLLFAPAIAYAGHPLKIGFRDVLEVVGRQLISAIVTAIAGFSLRYLLPDDMSRIVRIIVLAPVCFGVYFSMAVGVFRLRRPLEVIGKVARNFLPTRLSNLMFGAILTETKRP